MDDFVQFEAKYDTITIAKQQNRTIILLITYLMRHWRVLFMNYMNQHLFY